MNSYLRIGVAAAAALVAYDAIPDYAEIDGEAKSGRAAKIIGGLAIGLAAYLVLPTLFGDGKPIGGKR